MATSLHLCVVDPQLSSSYFIFHIDTLTSQNVSIANVSASMSALCRRHAADGDENSCGQDKGGHRGEKSTLRGRSQQISVPVSVFQMSSFFVKPT